MQATSIFLAFFLVHFTVTGTGAEKCTKSNCHPPYCRCDKFGIPGTLAYDETPQFVYLTYDDAINAKNIEHIRRIFAEVNYENNTCPAVGTFFVSHEYTDYSLVNELYSQGHEIALHSITHSHMGNPKDGQLTAEFVGQRQIVAEYADIPETEIAGIRMPFLQLAGDEQYKMLYDNGFVYDFSRTQWSSKRMWPYTLDYESNQDCFLGPCPRKSYPGLWQIPIISWRDLNGLPCSFTDGCSNMPTDVDGLVDFFILNFARHYTKGSKAPFSFCIHLAWFDAEDPPLLGQHRLAAYIKFIRYLKTLPDVFIVSASEVIDWIQHPIPVSRMLRQGPDCRPITEPCEGRPCNSCKGQELRWFVSCKKQCPVSYPWLDNYLGDKECKHT